MSSPTEPFDPVAAAIAAVYAQVHAPTWASRNLDALVDVLMDLSWLPPGPVRLVIPAPPADGQRATRRWELLALALTQVVADTVDSARPVTLHAR